MQSYRLALGAGASSRVAATDRASSTWKPLLGMAEIHLALGRHDEAVSCLQRARDLAPASAAVAAALSRALTSRLTPIIHADPPADG
jgi:cytochrome c-type biogenesis protein CcmH/NrfG